MKILFAGGGTMGPVTPLLAVWEAWRKRDPKVEAIWVGTKHGPECLVVERQGMAFFSLPKARLTRYPSLEWITAPFAFAFSLWKAARILQAQKPDFVASAGGYTAVPMVYAAKLLGVPVWVHQQDVELVKTTKLTVPFSTLVTVAWERNRNELGHRVKLVGNPVRPGMLEGYGPRAIEHFGLSKEKQTVLVFGGGSGAAWINRSIDEVASELVKDMNIIHITGRSKLIEPRHKDHHVREFLDWEMADAFAAADLVVCRAGMATITELAALSKAAVMIPLPNSPQEANARMVADSCVVLDQRRTTANELADTIRRLLADDALRKDLGAKMSAKIRTRVADELVDMLKNL